MEIKVLDYTIRRKWTLSSGGVCMLFAMPDGSPLPVEMLPGQFVQMLVDNAPGVTLRRPISICDVDVAQGSFTLYIKPVGKGTRALTALDEGDTVNMVAPLGHGFDTAVSPGERVLLAGGGVGAAPLVYLAKTLAARGAQVHVVIGGRTAADVCGFAGIFAGITPHVGTTTDDGSHGTHGLITAHSYFEQEFSRIYVCGPTPMMKAVGRVAVARGTWCEVSLENHMACGLGACLCCVEKTDDAGNVCVCTHGPVFNIKRLEKSWL